MTDIILTPTGLPTTVSVKCVLLPTSLKTKSAQLMVVAADMAAQIGRLEFAAHLSHFEKMPEGWAPKLEECRSILTAYLELLDCPIKNGLIPRRLDIVLQCSNTVWVGAFGEYSDAMKEKLRTMVQQISDPRQDMAEVGRQVQDLVDNLERYRQSL